MEWLAVVCGSGGEIKISYDAFMQTIKFSNFKGQRQVTNTRLNAETLPAPRGRFSRGLELATDFGLDKSDENYDPKTCVLEASKNIDRFFSVFKKAK